MEFSLKTFYSLGAILLLIGVFANTYSIYLTWNFMNIGQKISQISNVAFNCLLVAVFLKLYRDALDMENQIKTMEKNNENINKLFAPVKNGKKSN